MILFNEPIDILLVEDNLDHAELIKAGLKDKDVISTIHHVTDGEAALDYLFRRGEYADPAKSPRPHVILLDLRLPKIDGLEVLKEIKQSDELKSIPVVVLTTSASEKDLLMAYGQYVNSYLVKPMDAAKFTQMMKDLQFYWLKWNTLPKRHKS